MSIDCVSLVILGWQFELPSPLVPSPPLPPPLPPPLLVPLLPVLGVARVDALNCMGEEEVSVSATPTGTSSEVSVFVMFTGAISTSSELPGRFPEGAAVL